MIDISKEPKEKKWPGLKKFNIEPARRPDQQSIPYRDALSRKLRETPKEVI